MEPKRWTAGFVATGMVGLAVSVVPLQHAQADDHDEVEITAEAVPDALTHQGRLIDDEGQPISGEVELTYTIWDHPTEGAVVWQDVVDVELEETGFYSVQLGGEANPIDASVVADGAGWLGVTVDDGDELDPRISLNAVPFALVAEEALVAGESQFAAEALNAEFADEASWAQEAGVAAEAEVAASVEDGSIGSEALADGFEVDFEHVEQATGETLGRLSCANGDIAQFDGANWHCETTVSSVTATQPLVSSGGTQPNLSIPQATETTSGYLSAGDFESFDDRVERVDAGIGLVVDDPEGSPELSVEFGDGTGQVCEGDDPRLSDNRDPTPGSEHYIQNQNSTAQDASFMLGGSGHVDEQLTAASAIGAGTDSPDEELHVAGDALVEGDLEVGGQTTLDGQVEFDGDTQFDGDSYFDGQVGIGTDDPDQMLDVDGTASFSDARMRDGQYQGVYIGSQTEYDDDENESDMTILLAPFEPRNHINGRLYGRRNSGNTHSGLVDILVNFGSPKTEDRGDGYSVTGFINYLSTQRRDLSLVKAEYEGEEYAAVRIDTHIHRRWSSGIWFSGQLESEGEHSFEIVETDELDAVDEIDPYHSTDYNIGADTHIDGSISKEAGTFDIPHPDPEREDEYRLRHSFVESPTRGDNLYRYEVDVENGEAVVELPDYFQHLNENPQVWVSPAEQLGQAFGQVDDDLTEVSVEADTDGVYNVLVVATRADDAAREHFDDQGGVEYRP